MEERKRQFKGTSYKKKDFFDKRIIGKGYKKQTRYLSISKLLPKEWLYVRVTSTVNGNEATLHIKCLAKEGGD